MDKVFYCGGVRLLDFQIRGADVELEDEEQRQAILDLGFERAWITDHLALRAIFEIVDADVGVEQRSESCEARPNL
jgi:tyrosyl-DNA phosphodiesterase 2